MAVTVFRRGMRAWLAGAMAGLLVGSAGACGEGGSDGLPPPRSPEVGTPSAPPTLQLTAEEQQAVDEVRQLFDEFMQAYVDLATSGDPPGNDAMLPIGTRSVPPMFSAVNTELVDNYLAGRRLSGTLVWEYSGVAEVRLDSREMSGDDPQIELHYCLDARDWSTLASDGDEPVPGGEFFSADAYLGTVRAIFFDRGGPDDPRWYLVEWAEEEVGNTC